MSKTLDRLLKSNGLFCVDFRTGSPKDIVGNLTPTVVGSPVMTQGQGVRTDSSGTQSITYGNNFDLTDLTQPKSWLVGFSHNKHNTGAYDQVFHKQTNGGIGWVFGTLYPTGCVYFMIRDATPQVISISTSSELPPTKWVYAIATYNGSKTAGGLALFTSTMDSTLSGGGPLVASGISNPTWMLRIGGQYNTWTTGQQTRLAAIFNRVLTPIECSTLLQELQDETPPGLLDSPHRKFSFPYKTLSPAQATTQGLVLDTDFVRSSDGKVRNFAPTSYTGTLVGNPVPAGDGKGMTFDGVDDDINFGDVTQLNSATKASISGWFWQETIIGNSGLWMKSDMSSNRFGIANNGTTGLYLFCTNPTNTYGQSSAATSTPSKVWQHITYIYDGTGATNADKLKLYVDGSPVTLTYPGGNIPATTPPGTGIGLRVGSEGGGVGRFSNIKCKGFRIRSNYAMTANEVRAEYLEKAKEITLDGELTPNGSSPISLTSISTTNTKLSGSIWTTNSVVPTTLKIMEESTSNERYIALQAQVYTKQNNQYGSWYIDYFGQSVTTIMPIATDITYYSTTGQYGYVIYLDTNSLQIGRASNGAFTGFLNLIGTYINKRLRFWFTRTSTGLFTVYLKIDSGAWTNIMSVTDPTVITSNYAVATSNAANIKLYNFKHFSGAMTITEAIGLGLIDP